MRTIAFILAGLLWTGSAHAQAIVSLSPTPILRFVDSNGIALVGGKLFTYAAGTTTKLATYTDSTGNTQQTNPIILNSRGEPENNGGASIGVWLQALPYKLVLAPSTDTDPPTNPIWTLDNINGAMVVGGNLTVAGASNIHDLNVNGDEIVSGNSSVGGTFGVVGLTTLSVLDVTGTGNSITGSLSIGGTLGVTGLSSLTTLNVSGTGNSITGSLSVGGTFGVTGTTLLTGALTTSAATVPTGGVGAAGGFTASPRNIVTCGGSGRDAAGALTDQTPVATEVYIAEVYIPSNMTVTGVAVFNGTAVSGNMKAGLANSAGVNVATSGSTAASGTEAYQLVPFTAPYAAKGPATYYVETFYDNNTQRANAIKMGACGASVQTGQTFSTGFTSITPPATFTANVGPAASLY